MDISSREFTVREEYAAHALAEKIATARTKSGLPLYTDAVAIDAPTTRDRDDAINFRFDKDRITVEVYIADPTRFIPDGSVLDTAAAFRVSTLYLRDKNHPMLPRCLADDALSLNRGRANPAIKISTKINTSSGKIESIGYEKCLVSPENLTYEEVSSRMQQGDKRFAAWNNAAIWLRGLRERHSSHVVLPEYDPESGIMHGEDGTMEYVSPRLVNSHNIVQEAMITANHACALLMQECFDFGVYRGQKKTVTKASYGDEPVKHAALGLAPYTHATSPNRRYSDMMTHRYLEALGDRFEMKFDGSARQKFSAPYDRERQKDMLAYINNFNQRIKGFYSKQRMETATRWLQKVFPYTDPEQLKDFNPLAFSILLKAAAESEKINEVFAHEIEMRIKGKGGREEEYGLVQPKDAVNILRYMSGHSDKNNTLWKRVSTQLLEQLAANPQKLDEVFGEFIAKMNGEFHLRQASFITKPQDSPAEPARFHPTASAVVAKLDGKNYTTDEFAIGFDERTSAMRAKLEFLRAYASSTLVSSKEPPLPDTDKVYVARKLYVENAHQRKRELLNAGYEIEEKTREFAPSKGLFKVRGYKYEVKITKDGKAVISVSVKRDSPEAAERIGLEAAIQELRGKGHMDPNRFAHTGLATFTGKLNKKRSIQYTDCLVVAPKQTEVTDPSAWYQFINAANSGGYRIEKDGRSIKITRDPGDAGHNGTSWDAIKNSIIGAFPRAILVSRQGEITLQNPPREILQLLGRAAAVSR